MLDDFIDKLISRLMAGAGLIMAAAIAAVAGAMAVFAFLSQWVGSAWAYAIVAAVAAVVVAVWALLQKKEKERTRQPPLDQRVMGLMQAHPTASFLAGMAAATLFQGKPSLAASLWQARKGKPK